MLDFGFGQLRETRYPAGYEIPPHTHADPKVSLVVAGSLEESAGSEQHRCGPFQAVVKPAGLEHSDRVGPEGARTFMVRYSTQRMRERELPAPDRYEWRLGGAVVRSLVATLQTARDGAATDEGPLLVLAALERPIASKRSGPRPAWLREARDCLHDTYAESLSVCALAASVGVHPVHFARVFRQGFGCTAVDYVHRLRTQRAAVLMRQGLPLVDVAQRLGFADQAHFGRVFKRVSGVTPGRWRALLS